MTTPAEHQFLTDLDKKLWTAADRLGSSLDDAVYKHAVLGLIFLKYVSDRIEMRQQEVLAQLKAWGAAFREDAPGLPGLRAFRSNPSREMRH